MLGNLVPPAIQRRIQFCYRLFLPCIVYRECGARFRDRVLGLVVSTSKRK
jgi:hypothetical protein